jgi:predicted Rossmann fold nucleotide-binding protein DprA/Smf involved in DNA uptake
VSTVAAPGGTHLLEWLGLSLTPGLGPTRSRKLAEHFGSAEHVFSAALTPLESTGIKAVSAQSIATGKSAELAREEMARARAAGVSLISIDDPAYPFRLKEIYDPPLVLSVRGDPEVLAKPGIAMVGTRHPTPYGSGMAERLACDLAAQGLVIISGMARGVDTASHRGAISAKGKTIAVFGTGIDVIYPKENSRLSEQILAFGGALISEFPLGTFAAPPEFPNSQSHHQRNVRWGAGRGGRGIFRDPHHGPLCARTKSRRICRPRQCHQQKLLGTQHPHQTGRQAGCDLGRRMGGSPGRSTTCAEG